MNLLGSGSTWEIKGADKTNPLIINATIKIVKKRSFIDAVLSSTGSSAFFTQDIGEGFTNPSKAGITANQIRYIHSLMESGGIDGETIHEMMHQIDAEKDRGVK